MPFAHYPVTSVASLTIDGQSIPPGDPVSTPGFYFTPTMLMLNGYSFRRGFGNVVINTTAGYAEIPDELAQACIELVNVRYAEKKRPGLVSEALAGQTTAYSQRDVPPSVATMLGAFRKVVPI
jgi:hypothetical protein